jgi:putative endonuclease
MLICSDKSYYTGHTDNIEKRISEHKQSIYPCSYTKTRLPVEVVFIQSFTTRNEAFIAERKIKNGAGPKRKR